MAVALTALTGCTGGSTAVSPTPSGRADGAIDVGRDSTAVALGAGRAWVGNSGDGTLSVINVASGRVTRTIRIGDTGVLQGRSCAPGTVHSAPDGSYSVRRCDLPSAVVFAAGSVWVTKDDDPALLELDPATYAVKTRIKLDLHPFLMTAGGGAIWITDYENSALSRVDIASRKVVTTLRDLRPGPSGVAAGPEGVWTANRRAYAATHVDPATNEVVAVVPVGGTPEEVPSVGGSPLAVAVADGSAWIKNEYAGTVSRIDPATNRVVANIPVGPKEGRDGVDTLAVDGPYIWVTGMRIQRIDSRTNTVDRTLEEDASTIAVAADGSLWVTDIAGRVRHLRPR